MSKEMQHVFISYVKENRTEVDRLCDDLSSHDIRVWRDKNDIPPGARWPQTIRGAIREVAFFIACFSKEYNDRDKTYMNEKLMIAIEKLRQLPHDRVWFIPVKLNECEIPDFDIGMGGTLRDFHYVNLYEDWDVGVQNILTVIPLALAGFDKTIKLEPDNPYVYIVRGITYDRKGKPELALADFNKAIKLEPDNSTAYHKRALIYTKKGELERAIQDYTQAIALKPNYADAYYNRGGAFLRIGERDKAKADLETARNLGSEAITALDKILKDYDRAWKVLGNS